MSALHFLPNIVQTLRTCYISLLCASFNKLTDRFFKSSPWPEAETVAKVVHGDQLFLILYKELYYRHVYARVQVIQFCIGLLYLHLFSY